MPLYFTTDSGRPVAINEGYFGTIADGASLIVTLRQTFR